jgi:hypothetical protein
MQAWKRFSCVLFSLRCRCDLDMDMDFLPGCLTCSDRLTSTILHQPILAMLRGNHDMGNEYFDLYVYVSSMDSF